jgi:hypothetical protein
VIRFFVEEKTAEFIENIKKAKERFSWDRMVRLIETVACGGDPRTPQRESSCMPL